MAVIKKFNPKNIYFPKRLESKLDTIFDFPVTIIEAPTGYGKTTTIREFLKNSGRPYIWFNIDTTDKEDFYNDFCQRIKSINESVANRLKSIGYPSSDNNCKQIATALSDLFFHEKTIFIMDNYQLISDDYFNKIIKDLSGSLNKNLSMIFVTQAINSGITFDLIMNRKINYFSKADFELDKEEISEYFRICGIKLSEEESEFLYEYTEGWISALYLQMLSYNSTNSFEPTVDIENLLGKAIWNNLDRKSQDFLIGMSVFKSFSFRQAVYIGNGSLLESQIGDLLKESGFIKYDPKEGKYYIHSILRYFLESEFEKLENIFKRIILKRAADWHRENENYSEAILFYYKIKSFEEILSMDYSNDVLVEINVDIKNRELFMDIITKTSPELKEKYILNYLKFVYFLFVNNQREYFNAECENIKSIIEKNSDVAGEYYILLAFTKYGDLDNMLLMFKKASGYLSKPSEILSSKTSLVFNSPTVLSLFYNKEGEAHKQIEKLEKLMPYYYRLTDGMSKGLDALMKAELLLSQGNFTDSLKLSEKAIYMSDSRNQTEIKLGALMVISRISYLNGDAERLKMCLDSMVELIENRDRFDLIHIYDLCVSYINVSVNNFDIIPNWLTDPQKIEENTNIFTLGFANLVYGKYLILKGEYTKFLSISGQMLKISSVFNNISYRIYTLIYIAIAKYNTNEKDKAFEIISECMDLAQVDNIYIPFVENFSYLSNCFEERLSSLEKKQFCKTVSVMAKKCAKGLKSSEKAAYSENSLGLTKREMEVAKLAAKRMTNKEIADMLFIAESTVKSNLKVVFQKLEINSRVDLKKFF